jgi:hypothetical protein
MRIFSLILGSFAVATAAFLSSAQAEPSSATMNYAIMRNGDQIGTTTVRVQRKGRETTAEVVTDVRVKIAFVTVYRYEQTETERWIDGRLVALNSVTDDNGTLHKVTAKLNSKGRGDVLTVEADGKVSEVDPSVMPVSLWNAGLVQKTIALDTQDGSLVKLSVVDHGKEQLVLQGQPRTAHHYSIHTTFPQEVWYDESRQLIKVSLRGSDGSKIEYHPG